MKNIPRPEHPNPQWERACWENLNGEWSFEIDNARSAADRRLHESDSELSSKITVPFCPESVLSGIGNVDFMSAVCYKKKFSLDKDKLCGIVSLNFGAVDFKCDVYVNKTFAGSHTGGYTSFGFDITKLVTPGENTVFLYVYDDTRSGAQCTGKQSTQFASAGCSYTRTTGIWQTVWLEFMPKSFIKSAKYYPNAENGTLTVIGETCGSGSVEIKACFGGKEMGKSVVYANGSFITTVALSEKHLWNVGDGKLYDLVLTFGDDVVNSYFGLRDIGFDGVKFMLNGKSVFQRLVLDQGFYPDGIYTAKDDEALAKDVELSMAAGFNGARLHEKVFEPRFLYHCDKAGYLVWGEYPNWGFDTNSELATERYASEWLEAMNRDFDHPSIIGWCPFNETWEHIDQTSNVKVLTSIYKITKAADPTRPCIDTSGNYHVLTDIYDVHDYTQDPAEFAAHYASFAERGEFETEGFELRQPFFAKYYDYIKGMPAFVSEYGGIRWSLKEGNGWGYGNAPKTKEEYLDRYKGLTDALLDDVNMFGFCYTQLYDVEQEQNGLYTYEREPKFDMSIIKAINSRKAAIED